MTHKRLIVAVALLALGALLGARIVARQASGCMVAAKVRAERPLIHADVPSLGNANAPFHIVKFLDPASDASRDLYPLMKNLLLTHPGKIQLSIRYTPVHTGAEQIVKMLEAARLQGKYWQSLELLLVLQPHWVVEDVAQADLAWRLLAASGLDMERLRNDMESPRIAAHLAQDRADAQALRVHQAPAIFVNGQPTLDGDAAPQRMDARVRDLLGIPI